jgi:hypothetical protein
MNVDKAYVRSLADPHDVRVAHPKFHDGIMERTAGLRFRQINKITLDDTDVSYVLLHAGISNCVTFVDKNYDSGVIGTRMVPAYTSHSEDATNNANINNWRCLGAQIKFGLLNSPDESVGMLEAVRLSAREVFHILSSEAATKRYGMTKTAAQELAANMENNPSYMQGKLRDIHRFNFRLNYHSYDGKLDFKLGSVYGDNDWDFVLIRLTGRQSATSPSVLSVDSSQLQEIEYQRDGSLGRLMTYTQRKPDYDDVLFKIRFMKAGFPTM